jgi:hypothetical protein
MNYDTTRTAIEAFHNALSRVHTLGLLVSHDASEALNLARMTVEEVNLFVKGLRNERETNLTHME